jgi:hypothetical protein
MLNITQTAEEPAVRHVQSPPPSRRNLPRASQACQMCRIKKARCNQRQPCMNCIRHQFSCVYSGKGNGRTLSATRRRKETPGRPDGYGEDPYRTNLLHNNLVPDMQESRSETEVDRNGNEADLRPGVGDGNGPTRSGSASEEGTQHVSNGTNVLHLNTIQNLQQLIVDG